MGTVRKKHTKVIVWLLGILLAVVWGGIGYQLFIKRDADPSPEAIAASAAVSPGSNKARYIFDSKVRDPFAYFSTVSQPRKKPERIPLIVHIWTPPPVSLEGVVLGEGKRTVILSTPQGSTFFLSEGDTLRGIKVLKIAANEVAYRYQNKDTNWAITR